MCIVEALIDKTNSRRSRSLATQLQALNEMIDLVIADPVVRVIFSEFPPDLFIAKYSEPVLVSATARALSCVKDTKTHALWSNLIMRSRSSYKTSGFDDKEWVALSNSIV